MVQVRRKGSITFWAWIISAAIHLIVIGVLSIIQFSSSGAEKMQSAVPTAKIQQVRRILHTPPEGPKPKIKTPAFEESGSEKSQHISSGQIFTRAKNGNAGFDDLSGILVSGKSFIPLSNSTFSRRSDFFTSRIRQVLPDRKLCYLVDCSGSMSGMFGWVQQQLRQSIENLEQDQYFCIIFFGNDRIFEFGDGKLVRASNKNKQAAFKFIDSVQPAGKADAFSALRSAIQTRDAAGSAPSLVYFLTDGFELTAENSDLSEQQITNYLKFHAPSIQFNTIGFWPQEQDRKVLEAIARESNGQFIIITDEYEKDGEDD
jgi:Mg-chelatase subunit ChlD